MAKVPPKQQRSGNWVLAAMIFAVGMTFIDMTIVSSAARRVADFFAEPPISYGE